MMKRISRGDRIFLGVNYTLIFSMILVTLYPIILVVSSSLSLPEAVVRGEVWLFPKGFTLDAYKAVVADKEIWGSYYNTVWYVVVGTSINIFMTVLMAYPLSRKLFKPRRIVMLLVTFTMFFSGGLIPHYLVVQKLGLVDTRWALVIPAAISTYNLILVRTFFENIPEELHEAAKIDGSSEGVSFLRIVLPLSKPILAVMVLYYAVAHWNSYFNALIYLNNSKLYPLQMILRKILIQLDVSDMTNDTAGELIGETVRYASIIVSTVPILCLYPFLQKYFVKGVMIGAIKA